MSPNRNQELPTSFSLVVGPKSARPCAVLRIARPLLLATLAALAGCATCRQAPLVCTASVAAVVAAGAAVAIAESHHHHAGGWHPYRNPGHPVFRAPHLPPPFIYIPPSVIPPGFRQ